MKCLVPRIRQPSPSAGGLGAHRPHVGPGARLGHRQAVDLLAAHARVEVALALGLGAGQQDVGRSGDAGVVQRVVGLAELLLVEHPRHRVEAGPADLLGHVGGVETGGQRLGADLGGELGPQHARALDLLLVGVELALDERARHLDDAALLVGQAEVHAVDLSVSWSVSRAASGGSGGPAAGADGALHVAGDPLVGAADVERRLVGAVQGPDRLHVARPPVGDVALRPRVGAPQPGPGLQRRGRLRPVELGDLGERLAGPGGGVGGREGGVPLRRDQRRQHAVAAAARSTRAPPRSRPARSGRALARTARRTPPRTWPPTRAAAAAATSAGPR